jgi:hypothetical protein
MADTEGATLPEVEVTASRDAPSSTEGLQTEAQRALDAYGNLVPSAAEIASEKADVARGRAKEDQLADAEIANLQKGFDRPEPKPDTNVLGGLFPLLAIAAFGGKLTGANASAMLGSSIGMVQGYTQGKEDIYQENLKNYQQAYQRFRDNQEQIDKVYKVMREAYANRIDGDQKALQMAYELTGNQVKNVQTLLQDHENVKQWSDQVHHWNDQMEEEKTFHRMSIAMDEKKLQTQLEIEKMKAGAASLTSTPEGLKLAAELFMSDPTNTRFTAKERDAIMAYLGKQGVTAQDIVSGRARTKVAYAEARTLGTQKATLERVENALTDKDGIGDQAIAAAAALNPSDIKQFNTLSQLFARETSSGKVAAYRLKMLALRDEFATVINRGGVPTVDSRAQATEELDKYQVTAVPDMVKAIKEVAAANKKAIQESIDSMAVNNPTPNAPAAAPPTAATPQPVTARTGQTGHKEGDKKLSNKGKEMTWHNGQWEYEGG